MNELVTADTLGWIAPAELTKEEWQEFGLKIGQVNGALNWIIGDWLLASDKWGEMYEEAMELTGKSYETLKKYKYISSQFELGRRLPNLSWSHYQEVALTGDKRFDYLLIAKEQQLSTRELRELIKNDKPLLTAQSSFVLDENESTEPITRNGVENKHQVITTQQTITQWSNSELERKELVLSGVTVLANQHNDSALIEWAKENNLYVKIDRQSHWGNPFVLDEDGTRDEVIEKYQWYYHKKPSLWGKVKDLKGKVLGCWCYPEHCHGSVLIEEVNNL